MRIAYASPLPPATSGIADYSAELIPALAAAGLELVLFHEGREAPSPPLATSFECRPVRELAAAAAGFDAIVYQLGNSAPHHAEIYRTALALPGVVALHEYMLHHLVSALTLGAGDGEAYVEELRYAAGESGRRAARGLLDTHRPVDLWRFPLFERVVDRSRGVLVHSRFAARRVLASRAGAAVEVVRFPVDVAALPEANGEARQRARRELGIAPGTFVVGTFGLVTPHKRLPPTLAAFAALRRQRPESELWICGEVSPHFDLDGLLRESGADGVRVTGRLSLDRFHDAMCACDVAVNLRHPTGGETSASLLRLLGSGVPTLVTDSGSFAEIPDGAVAKVPLDEHEPSLIEALLVRLAGDPELRSALGREARRYVIEEHALADSARAYSSAIARLAERPAPAPPAPPLAPWFGEDPRLKMSTALGAAVADLGIDERDEELLGALGETLAGLGWTPPGPASR